MPKTPAVPRPILKDKDSAGWSWPRLRPINEQQSGVSIESNPAARSSQAASVHDINEGDHSPTNMIEESPESVRLPQSPAVEALPRVQATDTSASAEKQPAIAKSPKLPETSHAGIAPTEASDTAEKSGKPTLDKAQGKGAPPSDVVTPLSDRWSDIVSQSVVNDSHRKPSGAMEGLHLKSSPSLPQEPIEIDPKFLAGDGDDIPQAEADDSIREDVAALLESAADPSDRHGRGTQSQRLNNQQEALLHVDTNNSVETKSQMSSQLDTSARSRRRTNSSRSAARDGGSTSHQRP